MNNEQDNRLDDKVRDLYKSLPGEEPPAELDARILTAAHDEVAPRSFRVLRHHTKKHHTRKTWHSLAYAAVLVLCVSVVVRMQTGLKEPPETIRVMLAPADTTAQALRDNTLLPEMQEMAPEASMVAKPAPVEIRAAAERQLVEEKKQQREKQDLQFAKRKMESERMEKEMMLPESVDQEKIAGFSASPAALPAASAYAESDAVTSYENRIVEIVQMQKLLQAGAFSELNRQLKLFVKQYPGYKLPEDIKQYYAVHKVEIDALKP